MSGHRPRNVRADSGPGGWVILRFDCSCGMTGDRTTGRNLEAARDRARAICADHGRGITERVLGR
jgi:hypothetical protein